MRWTYVILMIVFLSILLQGVIAEGEYADNRGDDAFKDKFGMTRDQAIQSANAGFDDDTSTAAGISLARTDIEFMILDGWLKVDEFNEGAQAEFMPEIIYSDKYEEMKKPLGPLAQEAAWEAFGNSLYSKHQRDDFQKFVNDYVLKDSSIDLDEEIEEFVTKGSMSTKTFEARAGTFTGTMTMESHGVTIIVAKGEEKVIVSIEGVGGSTDAEEGGDSGEGGQKQDIRISEKLDLTIGDGGISTDGSGDFEFRDIAVQGPSNGYFGYDGGFSFDYADAFTHGDFRFTSIARASGTSDRIHMQSAGGGSAPMRREGAHPMDFNISFSDIGNANFSSDRIDIANASSVTITATSPTGTEHNLILTDIQGLSFTGDNLTLDHADSMIVDGDVVAINSDDIVVPFTYTHQLFNYSLYLEEYQEISLNSSDMVKVANRDYLNLSTSRIIVHDDAIAYANVTTRADRITYTFVNPFQDIPDIKTTLDKGEQVEYVNHNRTVLLDTKDVIESVVGAYETRDSTYDSFGQLTLRNATRNIITIKARDGRLLVFNGSRLIANESHAEIVPDEAGAMLILADQKIALPSAFSEGSRLQRASVRADGDTVVVRNTEPLTMTAYTGTQDAATKARLYESAYENPQPTCTITSDGSDIRIAHGSTHLTIEDAGDLASSIHSIGEGVLAIEKESTLYTTRELLDTFGNGTLQADENTSIAVFDTESAPPHHIRMVAFYGENRSHEKILLSRRAEQTTGRYMIRMRGDEVIISDASTTVTVTNLEDEHTGAIEGTFVIHSGSRILTASDLLREYGGSTFVALDDSFAAVFSEAADHISAIIAKDGVSEHLDQDIIQETLMDGQVYDIATNGTHLTLTRGNETRIITGVDITADDTLSASVAFSINESIYTGEELWHRAENGSYHLTEDMGIIIYKPQEKRYDGGIEVSAAGEGAAFRDAKGSITTRQSSSILIRYMPPYHFSVYNGEMTLPSKNKTEHIGTINMVTGTYYNKTGYRCFFMEPESAYAYADRDTPLKDFGIESVEYYHLCLRKYDFESFPADCERCGRIDFLNRTMELNNEVRYLRYPFEETNIITPIPHLAYEGKAPAKASFDFGARMIEIEELLIDKIQESTISETDAAWQFFAIHEKEHRDDLHRIITLNPDLLAENAYRHYTTTFGPGMHMQDHILTQVNTNTIKIVPPELGSEIFGMD